MSSSLKKEISTNPRILVISGWYPSLLQPANGDFVKEQVRLLREYGLSVDVVFADLNIGYLNTGQLFRQKSIALDDRGNYNYVVSGPTWPKNNAFGLNRWIQNYVQIVLEFISNYKKPDFIHAHTYLGAIVANEIRAATQIPVIATEHYTGWLDGSIRQLHKKKGIQAFQNVDQLTAVSKALANALQDKTERKVKVLHNYIDTSVFAIRKRKASPEFRLICVGELIKRKQVDHAIHVVKQLKESGHESFLTIVGSGSDESALQSLAKELHVHDCISWEGRISNTDVATLLGDQDLLIHASELETFGLVIAEALCSGLPVISYKNKANKEFMNLPGMYVCPEKNPKALTELILRHKDEFQNESPSRISLAAQQAFGSGTVIPQLIELYREIGSSG